MYTFEDLKQIMKTLRAEDGCPWDRAQDHDTLKMITGFNGGNCNSSTGDFSYGIEGFLIENGKLTQPVSEMNVTGNMLALWSSLVETGNDPRLSSSWRIPSLVFEGVDFSGL